MNWRYKVRCALAFWAILIALLAPSFAGSHARTNVGSEHDEVTARLGADAWHLAGFRGQGIKVAVLDSGFLEYRSFLGTALPSSVAVQSFRGDRNLQARDSQHGILCAEVIHALAPDAELLFANWEPDHAESFLQAVRWAKAQGAKVVSCSLIIPGWSDGEGHGHIHQSLSEIIGVSNSPGEILFFASAGNLAERHWSGSLRPDADGIHQWTLGCRDNVLNPWGDERVAVELYGPGCDGLELQVRDSTSQTMIGSCTARCENGSCGCPCASVRFQPRAGAEYRVRVTSSTRSAIGRGQNFHVVVLGGGLTHTTANGSIPFPGDGPAVHAVGAVEIGGQRLAYSSCGPNSLMPKPELVAEVPFPSKWRGRPFDGTSAAAPQAAALAAVLWSRSTSWTAAQVSQTMKRAAFDLGPLGHDWESGHGLLRLPPLNSKHVQ